MSASLLVVDTAYLYFRAFFGVPGSLRGPGGQRVNAIRGTLGALTRLVETYRPTHLACAWDEDWRPQWRVDLLASYKAHRVADSPIGEDTGPASGAGTGGDAGAEDVPDDLAVQVPAIRSLLEALGLPVLGAPGAEADDVMGTLAHRFRDGARVLLASGDRDFTQLVDDRVHLLTPVGRTSGWREVGPADVVDGYGVPATAYVDLAALRGDPSDGIPGVTGIGERTAARLLSRYGDLPAIRERARAIVAGTSGPDKGGLTARHARSIVDADGYLDVASRVIGIVRDVPLDVELLDLRLPTTPTHPSDWDALVAEYGIESVGHRLVDVLDKPEGSP